MIRENRTTDSGRLAYCARDSAKIPMHGAFAAHGFHSSTTCFFSPVALKQSALGTRNSQVSGSGASKRLGRLFFPLLDFWGVCFLWDHNDVDQDIVSGRKNGVTEAREVLD